MKFTVIAAAAALAIAGTANAAINPGSDYAEGGELILSVWDNASSTSYTLDLGVATREFNGEGTYVYDLSADQNWMEFTAGAEAMTWDVVGSDRDSAVPSSNGYMTTAQIDADAAVTAVGYNVFNTLQTNIEQYAQALDGIGGDYAANESYFIAGGDYAGSTGTWGSFAGNIAFATATYGESMEFWNMTTSGNNRRKVGEYEKLAGKWTLADNKLVYTAVPVPAAVWLFGSSLIGLVGVARRRK